MSQSSHKSKPLRNRTKTSNASKSPNSTSPLNIAFFHPDLGFGGAERLIADACISLQNYGCGRASNHDSQSNAPSHLIPDSPMPDASTTTNTAPFSTNSSNNVSLYTSHHDPERCFKETIDGTIRVYVEGMEWPRVMQIPIGITTDPQSNHKSLRYRAIGHVFFATWRMIWCVMRVMGALRSRMRAGDTLDNEQKYLGRGALVEFLVVAVNLIFGVMLLAWNSLVMLTGIAYRLTFSGTTPKQTTDSQKSSGQPPAYHTPPKTASASACPMPGYDVYIIDQVPIAVPLLKYFAPLKPNGQRSLILFYCHFPDKLLALNRDSKNPLQRIYRWLFDYVEEWSMRQADVILVNSKFTRGIFKESFPSIKITPQVLYPSLVEEAYDTIPGDFEKSILFPIYKSGKHVVASINRFERKKNHMLALQAFDKLRHLLPDFKQKCHLIFAGGYDERLQENVEVKADLEEAAREMGLEKQVTFVPSFSDADRYLLLHMSAAIVYTPQNEHFGIVPVEAMYCKRPVVAVNNGGPTESIAHEETGYLCDPDPDQFARALSEILSDHQLAQSLGEAGRRRVQKMFSLRAFGEALDGYCRSAVRD